MYFRATAYPFSCSIEEDSETISLHVQKRVNNARKQSFMKGNEC